MSDIDAAWDYADPAGSEGRFRALLAAAGGAAIHEAEIRSQLSRALCLQRRFGEAHAELDRADAALPATGEDRVRARCLLERSRLLRDQARVDEARDYGERAFAAAQAAGDARLSADAAHMLPFMTPLDEGARWTERGVAVAAAAEPPLWGWIYTLSNNFADLLMAGGRPGEALPWIERALQVAVERDRPDLQRRVACTRARALRLQGDAAGALALAQWTLAAADDGERVVGFLHEQIAECCLALGRADAARPHAAEAAARFAADPWVPPDEAPRIERLRAIGAGERAD